MKKLFRNMLAVAIAAFAFTACEDVPSPYPTPQKGQQEEIVYTGSGTKEDPYTASDAIAYAKSLNGNESDNPVYIKGIVVDVTEEFSTNFGNATFTISDNGENANIFTAYRVLYLGNKKFTANDTQIKKGDEVIVYGNVVNYKGNTPETVQGTAYLYSLNGKSIDSGTVTPSDPQGDGTLASPYNAAGAIAYAQSVGDTESEKEVYIKGKVAAITEQYGTQFGNATFEISDDGTTNTTTFTIYRALYLGNQKYTSGDQLNQGDEVIVLGKVTNYKGNTPETVQGKAYLYSLNGNTEASGDTPDTPQPGEAKGSGTLQDPYNIAAISQEAAKLGTGETSDADYYFKGKISTIKYLFDAAHGTATFFVSDDGTTAGEFQVYSAYYLENKSWVDGNAQIAVGDEVIIYGKLTNYNGTLETASKKAYIYSLNGKTQDAGSGEQGSGEQGSGEQGGGDEGDLVAAFGDLDCSNLGAITLSDGTTIAVAQEDGKNTPIYHESTKIIRMYARNSININAGSKKIAKVVFSYDTYQGTAYKGNDEMFGEADSNKLTPTKDNATVTFSNVNSSKLKVVNWLEQGNSGGTQFRIIKVAITYAK